MNTHLAEIKQKISLVNYVHERHDQKVKYLIIHPSMERAVFTEGEVDKSNSLEGLLGLPIILSHEIGKGEIICGI